MIYIKYSPWSRLIFLNRKYEAATNPSSAARIIPTAFLARDFRRSIPPAGRFFRMAAYLRIIAWESKISALELVNILTSQPCILHNLQIHIHITILLYYGICTDVNCICVAVAHIWIAGEKWWGGLLPGLSKSYIIEPPENLHISNRLLVHQSEHQHSARWPAVQKVKLPYLLVRRHTKSEVGVFYRNIYGYHLESASSEPSGSTTHTA